MADIRRDAPSQRRHFRVNAPASAIIQDVRYTTADWSMGGFRVDEFRGEVNAGERLPIQFELNFQGFHISIDKEVEIIRVSDDKRVIAVRFTDVSERETELLEHFVRGLVHGEMVSVGDTIKRIDTPVTPTPGIPEPGEVAGIPLRRRGLRRIIASVVYLLAGGVLGLLLLMTLYGGFFRLEVDSAVVTLPLEPVVSQDLGRLKEVYVGEKMDVVAGQPLFRLEDDALTWELESSRLQLLEAKVALRNIEARKKQEEEKLADYMVITQNKIASVREKLDTLSVQRQVAENELKRMADLYDAGIVNRQVLDEAYSRSAQVEGALKQAQWELKTLEDAALSIKRGNFYDGERLIGDLPRLTVDAKEARERLHVAEQRLRVAEQRAARLVYAAPFSGRVKKVNKSLGNTVSRGETLLLLSHNVNPPRVDAFLTQGQIKYIHLGSQATVFIPALDKAYKAQVVQIDRTSGFLDEMRARYNWRGSGDKSALVQLAFLELTQEGNEQLTDGMAAIVNMPKKYRFMNNRVFGSEALKKHFKSPVKFLSLMMKKGNEAFKKYLKPRPSLDFYT